MKFCITIRLILTLFVDQSMSSLGKTDFLIQIQIKKVYLFNEKIKNILSNFIPHEKIVCDDWDPSWINSKIKKLIAEKNIAKKCYLQNNSNIELFRRFQRLQNLLTVTTEESKEKFYSWISNKLMDRLQARRHTGRYWKRF